MREAADQVEESSLIQRTCLNILCVGPVGKTKMNKASSEPGQEGKARKEGMAERRKGPWRRGAQE